MQSPIQTQTGSNTAPTADQTPEPVDFGLDKDVRYGLAYSGGVDSCYLLAELLRQGYDVKAYTILDDLQITRDTDDSVSVAGLLGAEQEIIPINIWEGHDELRANPWDRCYHCKSMVFGTILERMRADGRTVLLDGTNASDREDRRPGFRAIHELGVVSPLRAAGLTKDMIRERSAALGLPTANKPSYACYGAFFDRGEAITPESLRKTVDRFMAAHPDAADRVRTDGNIEPSPAEAEALRRERERAQGQAQAQERDSSSPEVGSPASKPSSRKAD